MSERDVIVALDAEVARLREEKAALVAALREVEAQARQCESCDGSGFERADRTSEQACGTCGGVGETCYAEGALTSVRAVLAAHAARTEGEGPR